MSTPAVNHMHDFSRLPNANHNFQKWVTQTFINDSLKETQHCMCSLLAARCKTMSGSLSEDLVLWLSKKNTFFTFRSFSTLNIWVLANHFHVHKGSHCFKQTLLFLFKREILQTDSNTFSTTVS